MQSTQLKYPGSFKAKNVKETDWWKRRFCTSASYQKKLCYKCVIIFRYINMPGIIELTGAPPMCQKNIKRRIYIQVALA